MVYLLAILLKGMADLQSSGTVSHRRPRWDARAMCT